MKKRFNEIRRIFIKTSGIKNFSKELIRVLWDQIRKPSVNQGGLASLLYNTLIRYSDFSPEERVLANAIMSTPEYEDWASKVDPGGLATFNLENKKFWSAINSVPNILSVDYNPSGHVEIQFDYSNNLGVPRRRQFDDIKIKQDLYFTFELSSSAKDDPIKALSAIKNYLKWILAVTRYASYVNSSLKSANSPTYIRALKFNHGVNINYLGGSLFDERDTLKIYFVNANPSFLRSFYDNVLSIKNQYSGFTINENRDRTARGFDLSGVPGLGNMSFGQILGYRMAFHLMSNISYIQNLTDDNIGKKEFLDLLGNIMQTSQSELIISMDKYTSGNDSAYLEKVLRESKIL